METYMDRLGALGMIGGMHLPPRLSLLPVLVVFLTGCVSIDGASPPVDSLIFVTPTPALGAPSSGSPDSPAATIQPTGLPPEIIPNTQGVTVACDANTLIVALELPDGDSPGAVSRVTVAGSDLLFIADGGLYRAGRPDVTNGFPARLEPLLLPGQIIGGRPIQELTDIDVNGASGMIAALDKAGHVFGHDPTSGETHLLFRASRALEEKLFGAFQFVSVTFDDNGKLLLLDTSGKTIWEVIDANTIGRKIQSENLASAADFTTVGVSVYVMNASGSIRVAGEDGELVSWRDSDGRVLGLSLRTSTHLGAPLVYVSDALLRSITGFMPDGGLVTRHVFHVAEPGLLRDFVYVDGLLYAVSDSHLWIYPAASSDQSVSPCASADIVTPLPDLYGFNLLQLLTGVQAPLEAPTLPTSPHSYPGASRTYRLGVHNGTDFYGYEIGTPVTAAARGVVIDATLDYRGMSYADFQQLTFDSEALGLTPPNTLSRLEGRKVALDHGNGIVTVYAHLNSIAEGIAPGVLVEAGQWIGTVGVTGTSAESRPGTESPHLHFELWLGDRYVGEGITIREAIWWLSQVLPTSALDLP